MNVNHIELVKDLLTDVFKSLPPSSITENDYQVAVQIFAKFAMISTDQSLSKTRDKIEVLSMNDASSRNDFIYCETEKVRDFVKKYSLRFWKACSVGIPFSKLDPTTCEKALEKSIESYDSLIIHLLTHDDSVWLSEEDLELAFGEIFSLIDIRKIGQACMGLKKLYIQNNDKKAGYYLLWLIKHLAECDFEIPSQEDFNEISTRQVLTNFLSSGNSSLKHPANFLELLHFKESQSDSAMYLDFLEDDLRSTFLDTTISTLRIIPLKNWPRKGELIACLLETFTSDSIESLAKDLENSFDLTTAKIGHHILKALKAPSMTAAIPHFIVLTELLPKLNHSRLEMIFDKPFISFRESTTYTKNDPEFTRRLRFNTMRETFVRDDLIMGIYEERTRFQGEKIVPHLLAYNMRSEKMVWEIPLVSSATDFFPLNSSEAVQNFEDPEGEDTDYSLKQIGKEITLQFVGQKNIHFIDTASGKIKNTIELPYKKLHLFDSVHLTPKDFGFQMIYSGENRKLIGGKITNSKLTPDFEVETPSGHFQTLSTHVGFYNVFNNTLVIFSSTGQSVSIECLSAKAYENKLYLIETDPTKNGTCRLTVRTLTEDDHIVTAPEQIISLNIESASIAYLCDHKQMILFQGCFSKKPIFVNLDSEEIVYSQHAIESFAEKIVNTTKGELWSWDRLSKKIWKISSTESVAMGTLESGRGTTLLHVDEDDHLYFVNV
ncbi:MAG: hypothetical protein VX777_00980 [Chlamydiota bacterium]|nr:hypothetical protein [Chlamydiota bacterium]